MNGNELSGSIPNSLASISAIEQINLSNNSLKGRCPNFLFELVMKKYQNQFRQDVFVTVDVTGNKLGGPIPGVSGSQKASSVIEVHRYSFSDTVIIYIYIYNIYIYIYIEYYYIQKYNY